MAVLLKEKNCVCVGVGVCEEVVCVVSVCEGGGGGV